MYSLFSISSISSKYPLVSAWFIRAWYAASAFLPGISKIPINSSKASFTFGMLVHFSPASTISCALVLSASEIVLLDSPRIVVMFLAVKFWAHFLNFWKSLGGIFWPAPVILNPTVSIKSLKVEVTPTELALTSCFTALISSFDLVEYSEALYISCIIVSKSGPGL